MALIIYIYIYIYIYISLSLSTSIDALDAFLNVVQFDVANGTRAIIVVFLTGRPVFASEVSTMAVPLVVVSASSLADVPSVVISRSSPTNTSP